MHTALQGLAEQANSHAKSRFRNLDGMLNEARLTDGWRDSRKEAAYGVDEVSAQAYEQHLGEHIRPLVERLQRKSSRATLVRRHDLPNEHGQLRPLGLPAVADKLLQLAVTRLLTAIYAQEFLRCSDGYRPHMGALDAVDNLTITLQCGRYTWVVEADIKGFFDNSHHEWMIRMLAERIDDQALRWLIKKWLKAGVLDTDGQVRHPVTGTPQGGLCSAILAKVDRHDALDWWVEQGSSDAVEERPA